jgi:hypothetical protein
MRGRADAEQIGYIDYFGRESWSGLVVCVLCVGIGRKAHR